MKTFLKLILLLGGIAIVFFPLIMSFVTGNYWLMFLYLIIWIPFRIYMDLAGEIFKRLI